MSKEPTVASELNLDAIEKRANAATPGPWSVKGRWHSGKNIATIRSWHVPVAVECGVDGYWVDGEDVRTPDNQACDNAGFIAHARTDIPALIARVRELETIIEATAREHECVTINADVWVHTRSPNAEGKPWIIWRNNAALIGYADTLWEAIAKGLADAEQT